MIGLPRSECDGASPTSSEQDNHCPKICRGTCSPWDSTGTPFRQPGTGVPSSLLFSPRWSFRTTKERIEILSCTGQTKTCPAMVHVLHVNESMLHMTEDGDTPGAVRSNEAACNERTPTRVQ